MDKVRTAAKSVENDKSVVIRKRQNRKEATKLENMTSYRCVLKEGVKYCNGIMLYN